MPLPVISVAQMREWEERAWAAGVSEEAVMKLAGEAVARRAFDLEDHSGSSILFLVGKGKNGGKKGARKGIPNINRLRQDRGARQ